MERDYKGKLIAEDFEELESIRDSLKIKGSNVLNKKYLTKQELDDYMNEI